MRRCRTPPRRGTRDERGGYRGRRRAGRIQARSPLLTPEVLDCLCSQRAPDDDRAVRLESLFHHRRDVVRRDDHHASCAKCFCILDIDRYSRSAREDWLFGLLRQTLEGLKSIGLFWDGGTKCQSATFDCCATGEMPSESRNFMLNEYPSISKIDCQSVA